MKGPLRWEDKQEINNFNMSIFDFLNRCCGAEGEKTLSGFRGCHKKAKIFDSRCKQRVSFANRALASIFSPAWAPESSKESITSGGHKRRLLLSTFDSSLSRGVSP